MGQWFSVQSETSGEMQRLSQLGLTAYEKIHGISPSSRGSVGNTALYTFAPVQSAGLVIEENRLSGELAAAAGPLFLGTLGGQAALKAFLHSATDAAGLRDLDGSFAIARVTRDGDLAVITDRLGTMHVYAASAGSATIICTSSLVLACVLDADWDLTSCREFLSTGVIFGQRSLFRGIDKLAPASSFLFRSGKLQSRKTYWSIADISYEHRPKTYFVERLASELEQTMKTIGNSCSKPMVDLTGGLDSRALLAASLKAGISFSTVVCGDESNHDVSAAGTIARTYQLSHKRLDVIEPMIEDARAALCFTDGEYDCLEYARIRAAHSWLARENSASINGSNGEIAKGYWWELLLPFKMGRSEFPDRKVAAKRFAFAPDPDLLDVRFDSDLVTHFEKLIRDANKHLAGFPNTAKMDNIYLTLRMQRWQGRIASATNRIWPAMSPFMFRGPMEAALSAPPSIRVRNRLSRRLIEHVDPQLAAIPLDTGLPAMPLRPGTAYRYLLGLMRSRLDRSPEDKAGVGSKTLESARDVLLSRNRATGALFKTSALATLVDTSPGKIVGTPLSRAVTLEFVAQTLQDYRRTPTSVTQIPATIS